MPNRPIETTAIAVIPAPFGRVGIWVGDGCLERLELLSGDGPLRAPVSGLSVQVAQQLAHYFRSPRFRFSVPLQPLGTPFQQRVWASLGDIPVGEVRTYGELATALGTGARAVGGACRANPVPIIVPCHRVVAAVGIGGFAGHTMGAQLAWKHWLLAHEGRGFPATGP